MDLKKLVRDQVYWTIAGAKGFPPPLIESVSKHPRTETFVDGVTNQLQLTIAAHVARGGKMFKTETLRGYVTDMTLALLQSIKNEADRQHESDIKRSQRKAEADLMQDVVNTDAGTPTGEFADMIKEGGLIIKDTKSVETIQ